MGATALLGAAVVALPAIAGSETEPTIKAENAELYEVHRWSPPQATIAVGGTVTLSNPTAVKHGVHWINPPASPSCEEGAGKVPVGSEATASATEWSGKCTFATAGTYVFYCTVHGSSMAGSITVASGATTTSTSTEPPTPVTTTGGGTVTETGPAATPGSSAAHGSPLLGTAGAVRLAGSQHGRTVRGSVIVSPAGAGGRLEVDLLARGASLAGTGHAKQVRVGRIVRSSLREGPVHFSVALVAKAKSALKRRGHLALSVKVVLTPAGGPAVTVTRGLVLHS